jgi:hypothetical protein
MPLVVEAELGALYLNTKEAKLFKTNTAQNGTCTTLHTYTHQQHDCGWHHQQLNSAKEHQSHGYEIPLVKGL